MTFALLNVPKDLTSAHLFEALVFGWTWTAFAILAMFSRYLQKRRAGKVLWNLSFSHCTSQSVTIDLEIEKGWLQQPDHHQGSQQESKGGDK